MFKTENIKKKYEYSCDVLTSIYCNLFYIKSKNNKYLSSKRIENIEGIKFCFRKINHRHIKFTSNFLQMLEKWSESDYLNDNDDLLDIFLITIIHLRNESNITVNIYDSNKKSSWPVANRSTIINQEKLKRIIDVVLN